MKRQLAVILTSTALLSGCGTYMEAKQNTRAGGAIDQQKASARVDLTAAQTANIKLQDDKMQREREVERMDKRLRAAQNELDQQNKALNDALRSRQISQARHDQVKRDLDGIKAEMSNMELQNRMDAGTPANPQAQAEKEKKLAALEKRKNDLNAAMSAMLKR